MASETHGAFCEYAYRRIYDEEFGANSKIKPPDKASKPQDQALLLESLGDLLKLEDLTNCHYGKLCKRGNNQVADSAKRFLLP